MKWEVFNPKDGVPVMVTRFKWAAMFIAWMEGPFDYARQGEGWTEMIIDPDCKHKREHLNVSDTQGAIGHFRLDEIPEDGVRSIDMFDGKGHRLFSLSVSTNGVAYQVLPRGEDKGIYTITDDEV